MSLEKIKGIKIEEEQEQEEVQEISFEEAERQFIEIKKERENALLSFQEVVANFKESDSENVRPTEKELSRTARNICGNLGNRLLGFHSRREEVEQREKVEQVEKDFGLFSQKITEWKEIMNDIREKSAILRKKCEYNAIEAAKKMRQENKVISVNDEPMKLFEIARQCDLIYCGEEL